MAEARENETGGLARAITLATVAHAGQFDKAGEPYILHPLRVMLEMETDAERIAAVLHDVVEDSDWTVAQLAQEGFDGDVMEAVSLLTRKRGEEYAAYIERLATHPIARRVKLADLADNLDPKRLKKCAGNEDVPRRVDKYARAILQICALPSPGRSAVRG